MANKFRITERGVLNPDMSEVPIGTIVEFDGDLPDKYVNKGQIVIEQTDDKGEKTLVVATPKKKEKSMTVQEKQAAVEKQKAARRKRK